MLFHTILNQLQRLAARSHALTYFAVKLRNQANKVIAYSLVKTHHSDQNGEIYILNKISHKLHTIFDVGANKGEWTESLLNIGVSQLDTTFHLFEPGKNAFEIIKKKFEKEEGIVTLNLGLADVNSERVFFEEANAGEQSSFAIANSHQHFTKRTLHLKTIDTYCAEEGIDYINLLKIDCEGYDFKVMLGAHGLLKNNSIDYVQFEYGELWANVGSTLAGAINFLESFNYTVYLISAKGLKNHKREFYGEYFGYSNYLAVKQGIPIDDCLISG